MSDRHGADSPFKDRKRSAHWSDDDTTVLLNHLLAHKDSGRTADNGFKPEIWRDAAALFTGPPGYRRNRQSSTATDGHAEALAPAARTTLSGNMGGPKTPEACKSRWQRLQRDYRAVREMEDVQGFEFDRSAWKLKASAEDWGKAENSITDASKFQKIHLPHYDSLAILCSNEIARSRIRTKPRISFAASSSTELGPDSTSGDTASRTNLGTAADLSLRDGHPAPGGRSSSGKDLSLSVNGATSRLSQSQTQPPHHQVQAQPSSPSAPMNLQANPVWPDHGGGVATGSMADYSFGLPEQNYMSGGKVYQAYTQDILRQQQHNQQQQQLQERQQQQVLQQQQILQQQLEQSADPERPSPPKRPRAASRQASDTSIAHHAQLQRTASGSLAVNTNLLMLTPANATHSLESTPMHSPVVSTAGGILYNPGLLGSPEVQTTGLIGSTSIMQSPAGSFFMPNSMRSGDDLTYANHSPHSTSLSTMYPLDHTSLANLPQQQQQQQQQPQASPPLLSQQDIQQQAPPKAGRSTPAKPTAAPAAKRAPRGGGATRATKRKSQLSTRHALLEQQDPQGMATPPAQTPTSEMQAPPAPQSQRSPHQSVAGSHPITPGQSSTSITSFLPPIRAPQSRPPQQLTEGTVPQLLAETTPPQPSRSQPDNTRTSVSAAAAALAAAPPAAMVPQVATVAEPAVAAAPPATHMPSQPQVLPAVQAPTHPPSLRSPGFRLSLDTMMPPPHEVSASYFPPYGYNLGTNNAGGGMIPTYPSHAHAHPLTTTAPLSALPVTPPVQIVRPDHVRRVDAIVKLQVQEVEMLDDDLVEVMAEFETNVAAADTYLAIQKDGLRKLWLTKLVARRKADP